MNPETPLSPRPLQRLSDPRHRVMTARELREHGISAAQANERCRPGGPWQMPLPGVYLLHADPPSGTERLRAALRFAAGREAAGAGSGVVLTGQAALALHGFAAAPRPEALERVDVLVARTRRLRSADWVRIVRAHALPRPVELDGFPAAPVPRALADAVGRIADAATVRTLLIEAVRGGHCDALAVVRELSRARLLNRPHVINAVETLLAEGRALAEGLLMALVRDSGLPDPCWNVELRLPGGPRLGRVDAYWPDHAVAVDIDARTSRQDREAMWVEYAQKREALERLGVTLVCVTPRKLRETPELQATVVRTALLAAAERPPGAYLVVTPR
jgi:hypothetical protein